MTVYSRQHVLCDGFRNHLKITALCGHSMISPAMIDHHVEKIKKGEITPEEAGKKLAKPCPCGIFNIPRAVDELKMAAAEKATG